jgi:hypothetical protein
VVAGDRQDVAELAGLQAGAERRIAAVDLVAGHPPGRRAGVEGGADHRQGQRGFGGERHVVGDPGGGAAGRVVGP